MFILGTLIAVGAAVVFAAMGLLTLWGGFDALSREVTRGFLRSGASPGQRVLTMALVGLPIVATGLFGLLAAGRILQVGLGLS